MHKTSLLLSTLFAGSLLVSNSFAEISILLNVDRVSDASGAPNYVDTSTGSWLLVADTTQDGFQPVTPGSIGVSDFTSGDDIIVARGDFQIFFTPGVISANPTGLTLGGGWDAGDPLALIWFPEGGPGRSTAAANDAYGFFSDSWVTPADGTLNYSLDIISTDTNGIFGSGGGSPVDAGLLGAGLTVVPEPSATLLILLPVLGLLRRRR